MSSGDGTRQIKLGSRKEVKQLPKQYHKPALVEYGRIGELTLGSGGTEPDFGATLNLINNICTAALPATACLAPVSGAS